MTHDAVFCGGVPLVLATGPAGTPTWDLDWAHAWANHQRQQPRKKAAGQRPGWHSVACGRPGPLRGTLEMRLKECDLRHRE